jgi:hypothetical protein
MLNKYRPGRKKPSSSNKLDAKAKPWNPSSSSRTGRTYSTTVSNSSMSTMMIEQLDLPTFPQFNELNGELRQHILSFVAEAPLEGVTMIAPNATQQNNRSTAAAPAGAALTTTLPLVNKEFRRWSAQDEYWEPALRRRINDKSCGTIWTDGLRRLLPLGFEIPPPQPLSNNTTTTATTSSNTTSNNNNNGDTTTRQGTDIIQVVRTHLHERRQDLTHKELYKKVVTTHLQFDAPIFIMPYTCSIGEVYGVSCWIDCCIRLVGSA